jgi:hypothetical protein
LLFLGVKLLLWRQTKIKKASRYDIQNSRAQRKETKRIVTKMNNEGIPRFCSSHNIIKVIKQRRWGDRDMKEAVRRWKMHTDLQSERLDGRKDVQEKYTERRANIKTDVKETRCDYTHRIY